MIVKTRCLFYEVEGQFYKSLEEAQIADLIKLVPNDFLADGSMDSGHKIASWLLSNKDAITCILTTTPRSRAKARKANGATRKRKAKQDPAPEANEKAPQ